MRREGGGGVGGRRRKEWGTKEKELEGRGGKESECKLVEKCEGG